MESKWMLIPLFAQVLLTSYVYRVTYQRRMHAVKNEGLNPLYFKTKQTRDEVPRKMKQADDLLLNLFEAPVILFAGGVSAIALDVVDEVLLALASLFVVCRILHAKELLGRNSIRKRFRPWTVGLFSLFFFWSWLTVMAFQ